MNTSRLRRIGALALAAACFAMVVTPVLAIPATLSQPQPRTMGPILSVIRPAGVSWYPARSPAPAAPLKPPALTPIVIPPIATAWLPAPKFPVETPLPVSTTSTPAPQPPDETPRVLPAATPQVPVPPAQPAVRPTAVATDGAFAEFLVKFEAGRRPSVLAEALTELSVQVVGHIPQLGVEVVRVASGTVSVAMETLRHLPGVAYVEPNYPVQMLELPNDPDLPAQWHLGTVQAPAAWDLATGSGAVIAVIDTGVDPGDVDLKNKFVPGYDFVNNDAEPWDDQGHGTRIALIAAAAANNGHGGAGVAYDAQIMALKALNSAGFGTHAWISKAILWATDNGADIINLSIGGAYPSQTLQDAVNYAWRHGVLLVAAAGNENSNVPVYPAAYDPVLAVAGTTRDQQRASFSNWGDHVAIAAPGTNILVTRGNGQQTGNGTSLAAPQVAGVAALVLSRNAGLTPGQVREIIQSTANDLGDPGWDPFFGFGQVDAYQAVLQARHDPGGPDPITSVVDAVNHARQLRDLPALHADDGLMAAAQNRAESLTSRCMQSGDAGLASCLTQLGGSTRRSEVLLVGISSAQAVVDLLSASPAGQELLFGPYWQIGAGYVDTGHSLLSQVWVLRFAQAQVRPGLGPPAPILGSGR